MHGATIKIIYLLLFIFVFHLICTAVKSIHVMISSHLKMKIEPFCIHHIYCHEILNRCYSCCLYNEMKCVTSEISNTYITTL